MSQRTFYLDQASRCAFAASEASLSSRKAELLAAEKAWRKLAQVPEAISLVGAARIMNE